MSIKYSCREYYSTLSTLVKSQLFDMLFVVDTRKIIGKHIRLARIEAELSQDELAELLGITQKALSRWERGTVEVGAVTLKQVADALHKPISVFYEPFADTGAIPKVQARRRKAA